MITALLGSQSRARVLFFLFVNGHCYASQLRAHFHTALTPFQKALEQLEQEGVLASELHGKTRVYRYNSSYPLLHELEKLIQRAYLLLSPEEKKRYLIEKGIQGKRPLFASERKKVLLGCWDRLHQVKQFTVVARRGAHDHEGFVSKGQGEVTFVEEGENRLLIREKGFWIHPKGQAIDFTNQVRWELNRKESTLIFSPEKRGWAHAAYAITLHPAGKNELATRADQEGSQGLYQGALLLEKMALRSSWRVFVDQKNESIESVYF